MATTGLVCGIIALVLGGLNCLVIDKIRNKLLYRINFTASILGVIGIMGNTFRVFS